jgi:hypothetical protein
MLTFESKGPTSEAIKAIKALKKTTIVRNQHASCHNSMAEPNWGI